MQKNDHFTAQITMAPTEVGGRRGPFFDRYRPEIQIDGTIVKVEIRLSKGEVMVMPGDVGKYVDVVMHQSAEIAPGAVFSICEGPKIVGSGLVIQQAN